MENTLKNIKITGLFGKKNIDWNLKPEVNVLVGKNGVGKSIILQLIDCVVQQKNENILDLCRRATITLVDDSTNIAFHTNEIDQEVVRNKAIEGLTRSHSLIAELPESEIKELISKIQEAAQNFKITDVIKTAYTHTLDKKGYTLETEFISTVQASANASSTYTKSNRQEINILDDEIQDEIERLKKSKIPALEAQLKTSLNLFFAETGKLFHDINKSLELTLNNGETLSYQQLSAGERQLIYIFLKVANASETKALILMDEPEISLHLSWQKILINEMRKVNNVSQMIIVTHSPAIIMDGWLDCMVDIEDIVSE